MHFTQLSYSSIYLESWGQNRCDGTEFRLGSGSGAVYKQPEGVYIVTAKHVVSGVNPITGAYLDEQKFVPRKLRTFFADSTDLRRIEVDVPLLDDDNNRLWIEHPGDARIDVACVLIPNEDLPPSALIAPHDPDKRILAGGLVEPIWKDVVSLAHPDRPLPLHVPGQLFVIGFPFGAQGTWPAAIWVTGHIASEPGLDYDGQPHFLLDARTRQGLSGAPVVRHIPAGSTVQVNGQPFVTGTAATELVGIYSGRLNEEADLGRVWRTSVIREILGPYEPGPLDTEF